MTGTTEPVLTIPKKQKHVILFSIAFWLLAIFVPAYLILQIVRFATNYDKELNVLFLYIGGSILGFIALAAVLIILGKSLRKWGTKDFKNNIHSWAKLRYDIDLDKTQLNKLSEPLSYARKQPSYISETIEKWVTDPIGRKHLQHITLVETDDHPILFCVEDGNEIESIEHKSEKEFFHELWSEINRNESVFALAQGSAFMGREVEGRVVYLFWSDPLRIQLFDNHNPNFEMVAIQPKTWVEEVLPMLSAQGAFIGLNWGEEERYYPSVQIEKIVQ